MMELKPCPFCGVKLVGKEELWRHKTTNITKKYVVHTHPRTGCILDLHRFHFYNDPKQIEAWNRRSDNIAKLATEAGLSYGQYVLKMKMEMED